MIIAPLYDAGELRFEDAKVSYLERISERSRYATKAILFVEVEGELPLREPAQPYS